MKRWHVAEHPAPWRWDEDPTGDPALRDANNDPIICVSQGQQWIASPAVHALTEAAPEMFELLRVLGDDPGRSVTNCHVTYPCSCERHRARTLLVRIDAAGRRAFCPDCGAELTWPLDQEKPWPCGPCNEDQS